VNKSIIYLTSLIIGISILTFFSVYNTFGHKVSLEKNGLQFEDISLNELVRPNNGKFVAIATENQSKSRTVYSFSGYDKNFHQQYKIHEVQDEAVRNDDLFIAAIDGRLNFERDTFLLGLDESVLMWTSPNQNFKVEAKKLLQYEFEPGIFGFFDDSPFIAGLLVLIFSFLCFTFNLLSRLFKGRRSRLSNFILVISTILAVVIFTTKFLPHEWHMNSLAGIATANTIWIFSCFLLYHFLLLPRIRKLEIPDREALKFLFITVVGFLSLWISIYVGLNIDGLRLSNVVHLTNYYLPLGIKLGIIVSFTLGNLINNATKNVIHLVKTKNLARAYRARALSTSSQLSALQSSINPHFLYNSLNSIASLATLDGEKTERMALALSSFYKYVNNRENTTTSTVRDEVEMLQNYIKIEKIRFGDRLSIDFDIEADSLDFLIPRLTLQPLVENAVKYGFANGKIEVKIATLINEDELLIMIFDKGKSFGKDLNLGFGLKSVDSKLKLMFDDMYTIEFVSRPEKHVLISIKI